MKLNGVTVILRALEPEDLTYLYEVENNIAIWELSSTQTPYSQFVLKQYLERSLSADIYALRELRLVICKKEDRSPIGLIDIFDFDPINKRAGIGILISDEQNRGLGYASEALELLIDYSFEVIGLHQLYCNILFDNPNSIRLFQKFGFEEIGVKKDWVFDGQNYKDELLYQLIRTK
jgi:diamine N-acetyltransferase